MADFLPQQFVGAVRISSGNGGAVPDVSPPGPGPHSPNGDGFGNDGANDEGGGNGEVLLAPAENE